MINSSLTQTTSERQTFIGQEDTPKIGGVYKIEHIVTGKCYIGSSTNIRKRIRKHICDFLNNNPVNPYFGMALKKYGIKEFKVSVLELVKDRYLIPEREQHWLDTLKPYKPLGYNLNPKANAGGFNAKYWVIFPPDEEPTLLHSIGEYSRQKGISSAALSRVAQGKYKHTHGYWCRYATEEEVKKQQVLIFNKPEIKLNESIPTGERFITLLKERYRVTFSLKDERFHIGIFDTLQEAIEARDKALALSVEELREHQKNKANQRGEKKTSQYKGVCWDPAGFGRWVASIRINGKQIQLGRFHSEEEAAEAYNWAAQLKQLHGKEAYQIVLDKLKV